MTTNQNTVSTEPGGLGNRIKSWVSSMRLDENASVFWPVTDNMPARFDQLFTNDCAVDSVPDGAVEHCSWRLEILPEDEAYLPAGFATAGAGGHPVVRAIGKLWWNVTGRRNDRYRYMVFPKQYSRRSVRSDARHIDYEYERIPEYFRRVYAPLFARVSVQPGILSRVQDWADTHIDKDTIGVQVRTWRDAPKRNRKYHKPSVKRLERLLRLARPEQKFFVVSDSDDVAGWIGRECGAARVLQYPRETLRHQSWQTAAGMEEDLIDMLLLARAPELYASFLSTFSETAWWLGGAHVRVSVF